MQTWAEVCRRIIILLDLGACSFVLGAEGWRGEKQDQNCVAQTIPKLMTHPPVSASQMLAVQVSA